MTTKKKTAAKKRGPRGTGKIAYIDHLVLAGGLTAREIAVSTVKKFKKLDLELEKTLRLVRARPWHIRNYGRTPKMISVAEAKIRDAKAAKKKGRK